jgi:methylphosphotriester-DNA--protein-cysteine methyltransferase
MALKKSELYTSLWASCDELRDGMAALKGKPDIGDQINKHMRGFADQSHFSRVFARTMGVSPGAWRREHRM